MGNFFWSVVHEYEFTHSVAEKLPEKKLGVEDFCAFFQLFSKNSSLNEEMFDGLGGFVLNMFNNVQ